MKPACDPETDYKEVVRRGYDSCSESYSAARQDEPPVELGRLTERLLPGSAVLDLGCGAGQPVARALSEDFRVTGVDFSAEQIRRAKKAVPRATFLCMDVMDYSPEPATFDAICAFYVLFHLPRDQQVELAGRIHGWLRPGGVFLGSVGRVNEQPYTENDFFGATMFWTHISLGEYMSIFREAGFDVSEAGELGEGFRASSLAARHPLLFAKRR